MSGLVDCLLTVTVTDGDCMMIAIHISQEPRFSLFPEHHEILLLTSYLTSHVNGEVCLTGVLTCKG